MTTPQGSIVTSVSCFSDCLSSSERLLAKGLGQWTRGDISTHGIVVVGVTALVEHHHFATLFYEVTDLLQQLVGCHIE